MNLTFACACLLSALFGDGQAPAKDPKGPAEARLTFRSKLTADTPMLHVEVNGESANYVGLEIGKGQTVYVQTDQDFSTRAADRALKKIDLINAQGDATTKAVKQGLPAEKLKAALDAIEQEFKQKIKALDEDAVVIEGAIARRGKISVKAGGAGVELGDERTLTIVGKIRDIDPQAQPAPPEAGLVVLEGEMQPGKVDLGKGESAPFSVKNGSAGIAVAGKQAEAYGETKGAVRVTGRLRVGDKGVVIIDAEKVEADGK